jgi:hypothetical protein
MMRIVLFAVAGLLAGVGGGAGVAIVTAKPAPVAASDSAAVDSMNAAQHAPAAHDSMPVTEDTTHTAKAADTAHVTTKTPPHDSAPASIKQQNSSAGRDSVKAVATSPEAAPNAVSQAGRDALVPVRIGRIFAAMPARDAARVMEQLDDNDVRRILSALSEKQAAAIMALMPAARAAAISKATLKSAAPSGESHQ